MWGRVEYLLVTARKGEMVFKVNSSAYEKCQTLKFSVDPQKMSITGSINESFSILSYE